MTITFASFIFAFLFLFKAVQKNTFFILYATAMILASYYCESQLGWHVRPFSKVAIMLFVLFHLPLINFFTFVAYGRDKKCAQKGEWRIPEIQLHTLELLGGIHHKNKKKSYMATFFATIVIQIGVIIYILRALRLL